MSLPAPTASDASHEEHSEWGASGAHRWMVCAGSIALSRGRSDVPSVYAEEGTVAHFIGEQCLLHDDRNPADYLGQTLKGQHMEIEVTEDMVEAVELYVQTVRTDRLLLGGKVSVEEKFDISHLAKHIELPVGGVWNGGQPKLFGRNDVRLVTKDMHLIVYDYKHGRGHAVDVVKVVNGVQRFNPQLSYYALGALLECDRARKNRIKSVELVIVQPRAAHPDGPVRRVTIDMLDLQEWSVDLIEAVERTIKPNAPLIPGEHCLFCKAAAGCPALMKQAQQTAMVEFKDFKSKPPAPESLTLEELTQVLDKADMVETFISAARHHAHVLAQSGVKLEGWKLVQKRPMRRWKEQDRSAVALMLMEEFKLSGDDIYKTEVVSPAQAEKLMRTKLDKELLAEYWEKVSSGTVLAPEDDARPALPPPAVSDFAHLAASHNIID